MNDIITGSFCICIDGPQVGTVFEAPVGHPQLGVWGDRYRLVGSENGVALYRYVGH